MRRIAARRASSLRAKRCSRSLARAVLDDAMAAREQELAARTNASDR